MDIHMDGHLTPGVTPTPMPTPILGGPDVITVDAAAQRGTWDAIKETVVDGANWCGRSVQWLAGKIADLAIAGWELLKKGWDAVAPIFEKIGTFFVTQARNVRDFVVEYRSEVIIASISFCVGILVCSVINAMCCNKKPGTI